MYPGVHDGGGYSGVELDAEVAVEPECLRTAAIAGEQFRPWRQLDDSFVLDQPVLGG